MGTQLVSLTASIAVSFPLFFAAASTAAVSGCDSENINRTPHSIRVRASSSAPVMVPDALVFFP
jgi:hypothetical protein